MDRALGSSGTELPPHERHGPRLDPSEIPPLITTGPTFPTTPLPEHWRGEDDPPEVNRIWGRRQVVYLDADQRERFRIFSRDGLLYDRRGDLFDTSEGNSLWSDEGRAIFVMDQYGNFYASTEHAPGWFHHSSFLAGGPVAGAGELEVTQGRLVALSDQSGHYRPPQALTNQVVGVLRGAGVKIDDGQVEIHAPY